MKVLKELGKLTTQPSRIHPEVHMTSQGFLFNTLATGVNYKENKAKIILCMQNVDLSYALEWP